MQIEQQVAEQQPLGVPPYGLQLHFFFLLKMTQMFDNMVFIPTEIVFLLNYA